MNTDKAHRSQQLNLHLWKALTPRLRAARSSCGKEVRLYRFERMITPGETSNNWDFTIYTQPLISTTFDFIASLSIGIALPMMDYIRLSSIVNLGTLEISDEGGQLPADPKDRPRIIDLDRLFRAWASRAEGGTAFQVLRSLRVNFKETSLTTDILPHLNKFPALGIVYPGPIKWSWTKGGTKNMGKYVSDYDFRSIRPLLPRGWKGVTIRGPADGMMRDIHDSIMYSADVDKGKKLCRDDFKRLKGKPRIEQEWDGDDSFPTRFVGRLKDRHCLHELLGFGLQQRLPKYRLQSIMGSNTSRCATPDAPILWQGNFLVDLPDDIRTHGQLGKALDKINGQERKRHVTEVVDDDGLNYWRLFHRPFTPFTRPGIRGLRSDECLDMNGPRRKCHTDDAWNGRYVAPSSTPEPCGEDPAQDKELASVPPLWSSNSQQSQKIQAGHSTPDAEGTQFDNDAGGSCKDKGRHNFRMRDMVEPLSAEEVPPMKEDETWDFIKATDGSSSSGESEIYYESNCPMHPTGYFHTSPPPPHKQCYSCNRNYPASSGSRASWKSYLDDYNHRFQYPDSDTDDEAEYAFRMQQLWNHGNSDCKSPAFWNQRDSDRHPSYAKGASRQLKGAEWRLHGQDVVEGRETNFKMDNDIDRREFADALYEHYFGAPMPRPADKRPTTYGAQTRMRVSWDGGDRNYEIGTERVRVQEFGMMGMIRLDADLKAVGMDCGPAMLCVEENGERMLKVESKAPVVSLRIGKSMKWRSEGETVLLREDLPTEEEKMRAKRRKEHGKEELKAWVKPPRRKKESGRKADSKQAVKQEKKPKNKGKSFDENFWELTGMAPHEGEKEP